MLTPYRATFTYYAISKRKKNVAHFSTLCVGLTENCDAFYGKRALLDNGGEEDRCRHAPPTNQSPDTRQL